MHARACTHTQHTHTHTHTERERETLALSLSLSLSLLWSRARARLTLSSLSCTPCLVCGLLGTHMRAARRHDDAPCDNAACWRHGAHSCAALAKLGKMLTGSRVAGVRDATVRDGGLARLCAAAASAADWPPGAGKEEERVDEEDARAALGALRGLAMLAPLHGEALASAHALASILAPFTAKWPAHVTSSAHWAAQVLALDLDHAQLQPLAQAYAALRLPFGVSPGMLSGVSAASAADGLVTLELLRAEIPFATEKIVTRQGQEVEERRETCWMADPGVGGLACKSAPAPAPPAAALSLASWHLSCHPYLLPSLQPPSPTLSPTDPVPLGQLWPTGPVCSPYTACIQPICSPYTAYIQAICSEQ